jgi:hypothetical protein
MESHLFFSSLSGFFVLSQLLLEPKARASLFYKYHHLSHKSSNEICLGPVSFVVLVFFNFFLLLIQILVKLNRSVPTTEFCHLHRLQLQFLRQL